MSCQQAYLFYLKPEVNFYNSLWDEIWDEIWDEMEREDL